MDRILQIGLVTLGVGILSALGVLVTSSSWGPCGPSSPATLISALAALFCLPAGAILSITGLVRRNRASSQPDAEPR
ncbi:MAG: hypothetical protein WAL71_15350 [Terriglobales bacterium]